ncbi:Glycine betaine transport system permease protein OpuAB [Nymphon striatum]|nr:Glycine betaine transport system permease protein OpuAB [Nymphon striatum]
MADGGGELGVDANALGVCGGLCCGAWMVSGRAWHGGNGGGRIGVCAGLGILDRGDEHAGAGGGVGAFGADPRAGDRGVGQRSATGQIGGTGGAGCDADRADICLSDTAVVAVRIRACRGLIASAIYAAPPMARNVIFGVGADRSRNARSRRDGGRTSLDTVGAGLDAIKNGAMFYVLLPLRIGLDQAVLPFTWGFMWTPDYEPLAVRGRVCGGRVVVVVGLAGCGVVAAGAGAGDRDGHHQSAVAVCADRHCRVGMGRGRAAIVAVGVGIADCGIGEFSAFLAICAYAVVPMIRYTRAGLVETPSDLIEAAVASGATRAQTLWNLRLPYAAPTILLGLNQTILYAFAMLVIAALIGTTGLGQSIYLALGQADVGLGVAAGAAMAILALIADRLAGLIEDQADGITGFEIGFAGDAGCDLSGGPAIKDHKRVCAQIFEQVDRAIEITRACGPEADMFGANAHILCAIRISWRGGAGEDIHFRAADELGHKKVGGVFIEFTRGADLRDFAEFQHHNPVGKGHCLDLVMGDVDHR